MRSLINKLAWRANNLISPNMVKTMESYYSGYHSPPNYEFHIFIWNGQFQ